MSGIAGQSANLMLSDLYAQLSEFFKEPSEAFAEDVASGRLARFFQERLAALGLEAALAEDLSMSGEGVQQKLHDEYRGLFLGHLPPYIAPVESVYKKWTSDPECQLPIASEKGYLMGDPAVDMIKRYQAEGMAIPEALSSMPDHLALELEYMSFLLINKDEAAWKAFLADHLDWVDELVDDMENADMGRFYSAGAKIIRATCKLLGSWQPTRPMPAE